jgi:hypothetical protein
LLVTGSFVPASNLEATSRQGDTEMMRNHFRVTRLVLGLAFGLAIAALGASVVQAKPISGYGPLDPWAYALIHRSAQTDVVPAAKTGPLDAWAYAVIHRNSAGSIVPSDVRDHRLVAQLIQADRSTAQSAFNWGDAGIGASVSFGLVLLLLTAIAVGRRHRQRPSRSGLATS